MRSIHNTGIFFDRPRDDSYVPSNWGDIDIYSTVIDIDPWYTTSRPFYSKGPYRTINVEVTVKGDSLDSVCLLYTSDAADE